MLHPFMNTSPLLGSISPVTILNVVVLPEPFMPFNALIRIEIRVKIEYLNKYQQTEACLRLNAKAQIVHGWK
jgi:hypothetical protein